jgi:ribosomal protein S27AE
VPDSIAIKFLREVEPGPRGRDRRAGEPVLRRWNSPRFIRHSGLADTAHKTDYRVESLFIECWFIQRWSYTCFADRLLLRIVWVRARNYKSCAKRAGCGTVLARFWERRAQIGKCGYTGCGKTPSGGRRGFQPPHNANKINGAFRPGGVFSANYAEILSFSAACIAVLQLLYTESWMPRGFFPKKKATLHAAEQCTCIGEPL